MRWLRLLSVVTIAAAQAADYARERNWADEVLPALLGGEPVWLKDGTRESLGLDTPAAAQHEWRAPTGASGTATRLKHGMVFYDALYAWCVDTPVNRPGRLLRRS